MPAASVLQAARKQLARVHVCSRRAALCSVAPHGCRLLVPRRARRPQLQAQRANGVTGSALAQAFSRRTWERVGRSTEKEKRERGGARD